MYKHFLITRFNIRANFHCTPKNPENNPMDLILDPAYLEKRFDLFERYTFPSIKSQTNQNFTWIILFHTETPEIFKEKIQELKKQYYFVDLYFSDTEKFDFKKYVEQNAYTQEWFVTSRIDNDDVFDSEYIELVQQYTINNLHTCIVSFEHGQKLDIKTNTYYPFYAKNNHFLSMIGTKEYNILKYNHSKVFESGEDIVVLSSSKPMWTEIVHDTNVINDIKKINKSA